MLWQYGSEYLPSSELKYGLQVDSIAGEMGFQNGDHILKIGDVFFDWYNPGINRSEIAINNASTITILWDGEEKVIPVDPLFSHILTSYDYKDDFLVLLLIPV